MNKIEKRELVEQQRKIFEAGAQRVDRRTGSFTFLTWSFFLAPLVAVEEFLSSTIRSAAAEEENARAAQAAAASHVGNNDSPAIDLSKTTATDEASQGLASSSQTQADHTGRTELLAQPDSAKPNSEAAAASIGDRDDDSQHDSAHHAIHGSSVNVLADTHLWLPPGSAPESSEANGLMGTPTPNMAATTAPVEAAAQPVLPTATDIVSTLTHDVAAAAVVEPVLATATDTVSKLTHDVAATTAPVEAVVQPVTATAADTVSTLSHDVAAATAPVEAVVQPVTATADDAVSTLSHDVAAATAPVEAAVQPVLATADDAVSTLSHDVAAATAPVEAIVQPVLATAPVEAAVQPVLATADDAVSTFSHDVAAATAPVEAAVQPVLATAGDAVSTLSHDVAATTAPSDPAADLLHAATGNTSASDTSAGNVSGPGDTLLAAATATHTPIEVPESATTAPTTVGAGAPPASAAPDQIATASDVIAFPDAPPPANPLYSGTQYTQYAVALSSDTTSPSQSAASPVDSTAAHDSSAPVVADVPHQTQQQAPPPPDIVDTIHQSTAHLGHVDSIL
jgi:hypothetical protein